MAMGAPRDRIRVIPRRAFTDRLLADLHAFSYRILPEELAHFRVHAETNEVVHVFEHGGTIVGYQFWRTAPMDLPGARAILGGKLRVLPDHRGRALHLRSGLRFFLGCKLRHPRHALLPAGGGEPVRLRLHHLGPRRVPDPRPATSFRRPRGRGSARRLRAVCRGERLPTGPKDGPRVRRHRDLPRDAESVPRGLPRAIGGARLRTDQPRLARRTGATWRSGSASRPGTSSPCCERSAAPGADRDPEARGALTPAGDAGTSGALASGPPGARPGIATARRRGAARPGPSATGAPPRARTRGGRAGDRSRGVRCGTRAAPASSASRQSASRWPR